MNFEYSPYLLLLLAAAAISAVVGIYAWIRRANQSALALFALSLATFEWLVSYALEIAGANLETKYFWGVLEYIGIALVPYGWMIFSIVYSRQRVVTRRFIFLTALIPVITILLALTTRWHGLIWSEYHLYRQGDFSALAVSHGPWFFIHLAYSYLLLLTGTVFLARALWRRQEMYREQIIAMLIAVLAPWISNALYLTGNSPIPYLDPTPFAFTITAVAVAWAVFGFRLVDISPLARDRVIDSMREGMVVLDARGTVVDLNTAAARMIGIPVANAVGKDGAEIFQPWSHLVERFRNVLEATDEISVGEGAAKRDYEVRLSPLLDAQEKFVGRVILLRAIDKETLPQPRFATEAAPPPSQTHPGSQPESETKKRGWLLNFFFVPEQTDSQMPPEVNPSWYRALERNFTIALRLGFPLIVVGMFALQAGNSPLGRSLLFVTALSGGILALARSVPFRIRAAWAIFLVYLIGLMEIIVFAQLAEGLIFFTAALIGAILALGRKAGLHMLLVNSFTVFALGWAISQGYLWPLALQPGEMLPEALTKGFVSVFFVFTGAGSGMYFTISTALDKLNRAWALEVQAANLLQQERDLLEQRVDERTNELRKYFRALEQSGNAIVITDTQGKIEYVNPKFEQSTGYTFAEVKGKNPRLLKSGRQSVEYYRNLWETIAGGNIWTGEFLNRRKDRSTYWEFATIAPVLDQNGEIANYVAVKEDITERRKAEDQLRKLSQAVDQSGNTVIIMDRNGLIEYVNPKFVEITGYSLQDALGKATAELMQGLNSPPDFHHDDWWQTVNAGQLWHGEFQNRRKDGSVFWESATIAPVLNRDGEVINFVEIKQDISEQKALQGQLQKQNEYLSILHQVTLDLLNHRELNDLLQVVVDRSAILLDAPFSELMLEKDGVLVVKAVTHNQQSLLGDRVTREQAKLSWQAFDTQQPAILADYSTWEDRRTIYEAAPLHATVDFPVLAGERCLGVLALGRSQANYVFTPEQVETGVLFARLVALVLDNANLYASAMQELVERKRAEAQNAAFLLDIKALQEVYLELSETAELSELYIKMINLSQRRLGLGRIGLFIINENTQELQGTFGVSPEGQIRDESYYREPLTADHWSLEIAAAHNHTLLWENAPIFDDGREVGRGWKSAAALWNGQRAIGYLVADNFTSQRPARPYEEEIISLLGSTFGHLIENKRNETRLLESEVRFRQIVENASDIIYRTDADGNFIYFNPTAISTLGYQHETEVLGKNYLDLAVPEWRPKLKHFYRRQFIKKEKNTYFEFPAVNPDGEIIWLGQSVQIIEENGAVQGFQAVARDITNLVQTQEALALSRDQALEASRFKSQLLSRVSHELRTPLGGILGYAELLEYHTFGPLVEKQHAALQNIIDSTHYLTRIVNDLLDESQIESRSLSLHNEYFNPHNLLEKLKATMTTLADKKGLAFRTEITSDLPHKLYGDVNRLQQILVNLTGNAVKFTKEGEVSVKIKRSAPTQWSLEVRDSGAGIPSAEQQNIFEPFRQVDNSITRENRGSGLGLAITRQLIELMGGQISLESEIGKGSLFTVTLPILNPPGE